MTGGEPVEEGLVLDLKEGTVRCGLASPPRDNHEEFPWEGLRIFLKVSSNKLEIGRPISLSAHYLSREVDILSFKTESFAYQREETADPEFCAVKNAFGIHSGTEADHARPQVVVATPIESDPY
jgi:hypothetical protein